MPVHKKNLQHWFGVVSWSFNLFPFLLEILFLRNENKLGVWHQSMVDRSLIMGQEADYEQIDWLNWPQSLYCMTCDLCHVTVAYTVFEWEKSLRTNCCYRREVIRCQKADYHKVLWYQNSDLFPLLFYQTKQKPKKEMAKYLAA